MPYGGSSLGFLDLHGNVVETTFPWMQHSNFSMIGLLLPMRMLPMLRKVCNVYGKTSQKEKQNCIDYKVHR